MKVIVDGIDDLISIEEDAGANLHDFFEDFGLYMHENARVVATIEIDGKQNLYPLSEELSLTMLSNIEELVIKTISIDSLCMQTISELDTSIAECKNDFKQSIELIYDHKLSDARTFLSKAASEWQISQNTLSMVVELQMDKLPDELLKEINDGYEALSESFKEVATANEKNDFGVLKDLVEYELLEKIDEIFQSAQKVTQYIN